MNNNRMKFSGYLHAVLTGLIAVASVGFGYLAFSLYIPLLIADMNVSATLASTVFTVQGIAMLAANFMSVKVSEAIGLKKMVMLGVICLNMTYVTMYFSKSFAFVIVAAIFFGIALSWANTLMVARVTTNWFIKKQGLMLGIVNGIGCVGGIVASPVLTKTMANSGWRNACLINLCIVAALSIIPLLFLKVSPADAGQQPLGYDELQANIDSDEGYELPGLTFAQARKTSAFYILLPVVLLMTIYTTGYYSHAANMLTEKSLDLVTIGYVFSVCSGFNVLGSITSGAVNDKFGTRAALVWSVGCGIAAMLLMNYCSGTGMALAFGAFYGLGLSMGSPLPQTMLTKAFGTKEFGKIMGLFGGIMGSASLFAAVLVGFMHDATGNYDFGNYLMAGILVVCIIAGFFAIRSGEKLQQKAVTEHVDEIP